MTKHGWIIDRDFIADPKAEPRTNANAVGVMGPRDSSVEPSSPELVHRFRMFDDDGELYYEGRATRVSHDPLDHFGKPNAGATEIKYLKGTGELWETL